MIDVTQPSPEIPLKAFAAQISEFESRLSGVLQDIGRKGVRHEVHFADEIDTSSFVQVWSVPASDFPRKEFVYSQTPHKTISGFLHLSERTDGQVKHSYHTVHTTPEGHIQRITRFVDEVTGEEVIYQRPANPKTIIAMARLLSYAIKHRL